MQQQPIHGTKAWQNVKAQLKRQAARVAPQTPEEKGLVAMLRRDPTFIMSSASLFVEANAMLRKMEKRS